MRAPRDLLRRRTFLMRRRSELLAHVQLVNQQYNLDPFEKMLQYACNRDVLDRCEQVGARQSVAADLQMIGHYDQLLKQLEANLLQQAKLHDPRACRLLRTIRGMGKILSLVLLYEVHTIDCFPTVGDFLSYARLVTPNQASWRRTPLGSGSLMMNGDAGGVAGSYDDPNNWDILTVPLNNGSTYDVTVNGAGVFSTYRWAATRSTISPTAGS